MAKDKIDPNCWIDYQLQPTVKGSRPIHRHKVQFVGYYIAIVGACK